MRQRLPPIVLNLPDRALLSDVNPIRIVATMMPAMMAYSSAVTPRQSRQSALASFR